MRQVQWPMGGNGDGYGLGLVRSTVNGRAYFGHSGSYPGFISHSRFDPERRLSISVLTNAHDGPAEALSTALMHLVDLAAGEDATTEVRDTADLAPFEGRFATLSGVTDVVNLGGRLYLLTPTLNNPAEKAIELEMVSETELKVVGDEGYGSYGECMRYTFAPDGSVERIRGGSGVTMVRADRFVLAGNVRLPAS